MPRVSEIELTSRSDSGTWNWRAAGARQPRGTLSAELAPKDAAVGDVLRAELEIGLEGIEVVSVVSTKSDRKEEGRGQRIELIASPLRGPEISVTYASGGARSREGEGRRNREDRPRRDGARRGPGSGRDGAGRDGAGRDGPGREGAARGGPRR